MLEQDLRQILEHEFRDDDFEDVPSGQPGSDVIQRVKLAGVADCGLIIWESKNTKNWSDGWLAKVRKDQRDNNADLAVIVSTSLPKSVYGFDRIDGVWVTARRHAAALAKALRQALIDNRQIRVANEDRDAKAERVYAYVTTKECHQRITAIVEAYVAMREDLDAEMRVTQARWAKRGKELKGLLSGTAGLYGDLQGIVGRSMPEVSALRLPAPETDACAAEVSAAVQQGARENLAHWKDRTL